NYGHNYNRSLTKGDMMNARNEMQQNYNQLTQNRSHSNQHELQFTYTQKLDTLGTHFTVTGINQWNFNDSENQLVVADEFASRIGTRNQVQYSQAKFDFEKPLLKWRGSLGTGAHYTDVNDSNNGFYQWHDAGEIGRAHV